MFLQDAPAAKARALNTRDACVAAYQSAFSPDDKLVSADFCPVGKAPPNGALPAQFYRSRDDARWRFKSSIPSRVSPETGIMRMPPKRCSKTGSCSFASAKSILLATINQGRLERR